MESRSYSGLERTGSVEEGCISPRIAGQGEPAKRQTWHYRTAVTSHLGETRDSFRPLPRDDAASTNFKHCSSSLLWQGDVRQTLLAGRRHYI